MTEAAELTQQYFQSKIKEINHNIDQRLTSLASQEPQLLHMAFSKLSFNIRFVVPGGSAVQIYDPNIPCAVAAVKHIKRESLDNTEGISSITTRSYRFNLGEFRQNVDDYAEASGRLDYNVAYMSPEQYLSWCILGCFENTGAS